jgi:hypothetical protein
VDLAAAPKERELRREESCSQWALVNRETPGVKVEGRLDHMPGLFVRAVPRCAGPPVTIRNAYRDRQGRSNHGRAGEKLRFGCALAASLYVLVLAGCGDVSESGSCPRAQPSKKSPPTETAESHAAAGGPANCKPTQPDMLGPFYEPGAPVWPSVGSGYVLSGAVLGAT